MMGKPKIRFKGYNEDWEQRKLGEICDSFEYGLNAAATDYDGENKYIRITDIDDNSHEFLQNNVTSPDIDFSGAENYKLKQGDILFARTGASVGKTYIYEESDGLVYYAGFLIRGRVKDEYSPEFVFQNTLTADYERFIRITSQRSGQPGVNAQEYASYQIATPILEEQQQIGAYFSTLDHLITLHQHKCDEMKRLKKYMLQKMFPQNGKKVPEIRFDGFTNDWEQRKVSDMFKVARGYVLPATDTSQEMTDEIPYPVYSSQTKDNGLMGYYSDYLYEDAITWTTDGANAGTVNFRAGKFYCTNVCGVLLSDKIETNKVIAEALNNVAKRYVSYVGNPKLMNNVMADIQIAVPTSQKERDRISSYFSYLDHLITLHQHKCDELQNLKKYMLQNMFV